VAGRPRRRVVGDGAVVVTRGDRGKTAGKAGLFQFSLAAESEPVPLSDLP